MGRIVFAGEDCAGSAEVIFPLESGEFPIVVQLRKYYFLGLGLKDLALEYCGEDFSAVLFAGGVLNDHVSGCHGLLLFGSAYAIGADPLGRAGAVVLCPGVGGLAPDDLGSCRDVKAGVVLCGCGVELSFALVIVEVEGGIAVLAAYHGEQRILYIIAPLIVRESGVFADLFLLGDLRRIVRSALGTAAYSAELQTAVFDGEGSAGLSGGSCL